MISDGGNLLMANLCLLALLALMGNISGVSHSSRALAGGDPMVVSILPGEHSQGISIHSGALCNRLIEFGSIVNKNFVQNMWRPLVVRYEICSYFVDWYLQGLCLEGATATGLVVNIPHK